MASKEELNQLREQARDARKALADLGEEDRSGHSAQLARAEEVLAYAALILQSADPVLMSTTATTNTSNAPAPFVGNPVGALENVDGYASALLDALALIPAARDRELEQLAKDAAATFERSAQERLKALEEDFDRVGKGLERTRGEITTRSGEVETAFKEQADALTTKLSELETAVTSEQTRVNDAATAQQAAYEEAEKQRSSSFDTIETATRERFDEVEKESRRQVEELVADIRRMQKESAQLVGAIGLAGTADRYSLEVEKQRGVADRWRLITVTLALAAAGMGIYAVIELGDKWQPLVAKLSVTAILGGLAAYTARQSAYHRARERQARDLELELTAFSPFIEPLSAEQREEERVVMTRKTFGKSKASEASAEEEPGPTPLSAMLRRRNKSQEQ